MVCSFCQSDQLINQAFKSYLVTDLKINYYIALTYAMTFTVGDYKESNIFIQVYFSFLYVSDLRQQLLLYIWCRVKVTVIRRVGVASNVQVWIVANLACFNTPDTGVYFLYKRMWLYV